MEKIAQMPWGAWAPAQQRVTQVSLPDGRRLDVMLSRPLGEAPVGGWPLLVLLDGERFFAPLAGAARVLAERPAKTRVEEMVVVGIGHRREDGPAGVQRNRDFTHCAPDEGGDITEFGGAPVLRALLFDHILPLVRAAVPVDPARTTLVGHSLAGLFVLQTLAEHPQGFARWVSISPSLWWHTPAVEIATPALLVGCGALEWRRDMRDRIERWCAAMPEGARAQYLCAERADHGSAPFALTPDILRWASFTADVP